MAGRSHWPTRTSRLSLGNLELIKLYNPWSLSCLLITWAANATRKRERGSPQRRTLDTIKIIVTKKFCACYRFAGFEIVDPGSGSGSILGSGCNSAGLIENPIFTISYDFINAFSFARNLRDFKTAEHLSITLLFFINKYFEMPLNLFAIKISDLSSTFEYNFYWKQLWYLLKFFRSGMWIP